MLDNIVLLDSPRLDMLLRPPMVNLFFVDWLVEVLDVLVL